MGQFSYQANFLEMLFYIFIQKQYTVFCYIDHLHSIYFWILIHEFALGRLCYKGFDSIFSFFHFPYYSFALLFYSSPQGLARCV